MFQFRRFPAYAYSIQRTLTDDESAGLPHSEISGSMRMCRSPKLIAACHVLRRLLMPRHSPCALFRLTSHAARYAALLLWSIAVLRIMQAFSRVFLEIVLFLPVDKKFHNLRMCASKHTTSSVALLVFSLLFSFQGAFLSHI